MTYNKFSAKKISYGGRTFDSKKEFNRFLELQLLSRSGKISNLRLQVKYVLIPAQKDAQGKLIERECSYIADFVYDDLEARQTVVEDTKGVRTPEYIIKRKLMLYTHGIRVREI